MTDKRRVIALGFFDGIHIGHARLLNKAVEIGETANLLPSVITFDTHPLSLVKGDAVPLINSPGDRAGIINRLFGIDDIIFLHFDKATAEMPWDVFIGHLVEEFGARHLVAGHDFRFGKGGVGTSDRLRQKCEELGIGCDIIPAVKHDGVTSSSTYIRELISGGDIERANVFLGHPHVLTDIVRYGYRLGRTLGTPTINMTFEDPVIIPAFGVYATKVYLDDEGVYTGVTNIGIRPTIDNSAESRITAETHILNFRGNLYGRQVRIEFYTCLRPEIKFSSMDALKTQIQKDCKAAETYFDNAALGT
ncbi:MAG: riboflavin biosynthesis protein RibF [Oscillospiraceae bacterium]|nr:riboflavin biosynthesis protein RibF [Oscillospiraceae bacterium]